MDTQVVSTQAGTTAGFHEGQIMLLGTSKASKASKANRASRTGGGGKGSPYLASHRNSAIFRIRIPTDVRLCLGRTEYRRSLGRCYHAEAKLRALRLAAAAQEIFGFVREILAQRQQRGEKAKLLTAPAVQGKNISGTGGGRVSTSPKVGREEKTVVHYNLTNPNASTEEAAAEGPLNTLRGRSLESLTDEEIREIADYWLLCALKGSNIFRLVAASALPGNTPGSTEEDAAYHDEASARTFSNIKGVWQNALRRQNVTKAAPDVDKLLNYHGVIPPADKTSTPYLQACQEVIKAKVTFYDAQEKAVQGDHSAHDEALEKVRERREKRRRAAVKKVDAARQTSEAPSAHPQQTKVAPKVSEALTMFLAEKKREKAWSERTIYQETPKFHLFRAIVDPEDSLPMSAVSAEHLRRFRSILFGFPSNMNKKKEYVGITSAELIRRAEAGEIPEQDRMTETTVSNYCGQIKTFLGWASSLGYVENLAITKLLTVKRTKRPDEYRDHYTKAELQRLFDPAQFLKAVLDRSGRLRKPSRFWIPLLGLFTGARLEELSQLRLDDIIAVSREEGEERKIFDISQKRPLAHDSQAAILQELEERGETLCIFINEGKGQKVKTSSSTRFVPLSPVLIKDLSFISYLIGVYKDATEPVSLNKKGKLFRELSKKTAKDTYGKDISRWYNERYRAAVGVVQAQAGGKKDFHSFRDTIAYWCDQIGSVPEKVAGRYIGHAHGTLTYGRYSKDTAPHILYESVTLPFTEYLRGLPLDFEGLKGNLW